MKTLLGCTLLALACCAANASATTAGVLVPGTSVARDMVYDAAHDTVWIASGSRLLRYVVSSGTFLKPVALNGALNAVDLSPDGKTLAAGETVCLNHKPCLHWVDTHALVDALQTLPWDASDAGTGSFGVAYGYNGDMVVSEDDDQGSGGGFRRWVYTASTKTWTVASSFGSEKVAINASGDGRIIAYVDPDSSGGTWGYYDVVARKWKNFSVGGFLVDVAVDPTGQQFAIGDGSISLGLYNANGNALNAWVTGQTGVYDPVRAVGYFAKHQSHLVLAYDMQTQQQIASYDIGATFNQPRYIYPLGVGRTRISRDGSLLMTIANDGVHVIRLYAPLAAADVQAQAVIDHPASIPLAGSIGVQGTLAYTITKQPAHGLATVNGTAITYTPAWAFAGTDTIGYRATYGLASANATVTVSVHANNPPVANADSMTVRATTPVLVPVLANDSDPDGQALSIIAVTQPATGSVAIQGNQLLFTPPAASNGTQTVLYTISDGTGGTAKAHATLRVVNAP